MRTYARSSPYAAARIVALTLLADGYLCKTELDALDRLLFPLDQWGHVASGKGLRVTAMGGRA